MDSTTALLFFLIALVYSSAGFGGGSLYLAVLGQSALPVSLTRTFALACNALVTGGSLVRYIRRSILPLKRATLLVACSSPCVLLAAQVRVTADVFFLLLAGALLLAGVAIAVQPRMQGRMKNVPGFWIYPAASAIGILSGLTGIGGGVYLSPLLYLTRWGNEREIASACSLFIAVNSLAGLSGLALSGQLALDPQLFLLLGAVLAGGLLGSWLSTDILHHRLLRWITASLLIFAAVRILIIRL